MRLSWLALVNYTLSVFILYGLLIHFCKHKDVYDAKEELNHVDAMYQHGLASRLGQVMQKPLISYLANQGF
ncbi:hypothetical protein [Pseudolactococcus paracarnosus]|uniref:Uncharacterized protein n=1 Tax=Pseudolactococcus paracarnosus TaxID=2749962 RepID=A0ABT0ALN4_9LACT|nr:hypothetical protein [Lactococcus paracarnosus]MCJ1977435.1 hypothetical protein [Lactococcus paracarnosus]MCJ1983578.1 hypothetical protein [Lactococcus paracarnosus]MCJ1999055.1 hypothetical protein [Lactococcus paracarnosus]